MFAWISECSVIVALSLLSVCVAMAVPDPQMFAAELAQREIEMQLELDISLGVRSSPDVHPR